MPALKQVSRLLAGQVAFVGLDTQDQQPARSCARSLRHNSARLSRAGNAGFIEV